MYKFVSVIFSSSVILFVALNALLERGRRSRVLQYNMMENKPLDGGSTLSAMSGAYDKCHC